MIDAHAPTRAFEAALAEYTGAPYVVAVNSCTMALELCLLWHAWNGFGGDVWMPRFTYPSVRQAIVRAGFKPIVVDVEWSGEYKLQPLPIWDSARKLTSGMYRPGQFQCLSFHVAKILGDTQGGAILHDCPVAHDWLRRARFDGRAEKTRCNEDTYPIPDKYVRHCYMSPDVAARLLNHMQYVPQHNEDLPNDPYPDLAIPSAS